LEEVGNAVPGWAVSEEDKTAKDAAPRAGQGNDAEVPANRSDAEPPAASPAKRRRRKGSRRRARRKHPEKVLRLTTYARLGEYLQAFAEGHFHLLILVGAGGLAKSRSVRAVLGDQGCWIEGNATPFGMYAQLYRHKDDFVVIDDVDALYADRSGVRLLKCLCQTEDEKTVAWHSDARSLERQRIPREFTTRSRVVIISNDWQTLNKNVAALQDRGHVLLFQPTAAEVHARAGTWFDDEEIYGWFAKNADFRGCVTCLIDTQLLPRLCVCEHIVALAR
jgi:hypothetical protein